MWPGGDGLVGAVGRDRDGRPRRGRGRVAGEDHRQRRRRRVFRHRHDGPVERLRRHHAHHERHAHRVEAGSRRDRVVDRVVRIRGRGQRHLPLYRHGSGDDGQGVHEHGVDPGFDRHGRGSRPPGGRHVHEALHHRLHAVRQDRARRHDHQRRRLRHAAAIGKRIRN